MKTIRVLLSFMILGLSLAPLTSYSHGGKEHGPLSAIAPNGGMLKEVKKGHLELVTKKDSIELYYYDLDIKPSEVKDLEIKAEYSFPRKPYQKLKLKPHRNHWSAPFNKNASHRYNLKIQLDDEVVEWVVD